GSSDQTPSVSDRKTSEIRSGSPLGSVESSWFWSRARTPESKHWPSTIFWMARIRSLTGYSTPPSEKKIDSFPQWYQRSVVSLRKSDGENLNALTLRTCSVRNVSDS